MAKYTDEIKIGSGGFGEVWRCSRDGDARHYAKKRLRDGVNEAMIRRFQREARMLDSLDHPNIVEVVGVRLKAPPYYYVMPLYRHSLADILPKLNADDDRIALIYGQVVDALEYAHSQGCLHRDLKPENILMNGDSNIVVSDFGLGREMDAQSTRQTMTGDWFGTPGYMSPEQATNAKHADHRSDVFALGALLYHLYTGQHPFGGMDHSKLPPRIQPLVRRATHLDPNHRFPTVTALKSAWNGLRDRVSVASNRNRLDQLIGQLASEVSIQEDDARFLIEQLTQRLDDTDLLHKAVMQVTTEVWSELYNFDPVGVARLIEDFARFTGASNWGFNYTDRIADKCEALYIAVENYDVRSRLVVCLIEVGVDHNRWHVMGKVRNMLRRDKDPGEIGPLLDAIGDMDSQYRNGIVERLKPLSDLEPEIRSYFETIEA